MVCRAGRIRMKPKSLIPVLALCSLVLAGAGPAAGQPAGPERPGALFASVDGQRLRVVDYRGSDPVVVENGSRVVAHEARVSIAPDADFGPGFVTVAHGDVGTGTEDYYASHIAVSIAVGAEFRWTLTADRDLADAFLVIITYEDSDGAYSAAPRVTIFGKSIGRLDSGKPTEVRAKVPGLTSEKQVHMAVLIFNAGHLVRTSEGNRVLAGLFDILDHVGLQKAQAQRTAGSYPPKVYRSFPFRFSDAVAKSVSGQSVKVRVAVTSSGTVDHVELEDPSNEALQRELSAQMGSWLFLPRVVDGQAQSAVMMLPLKF